MINLEYLEKNIDRFRESFKNACPYEHVVIDNFCDPQLLREAIVNIPDPEVAGVKKSRDLIFAKNKFEKSDFNKISTGLAELKLELLTERFANWLSLLTEQEIFIDPSFHGGGLHQGGKGSFLNMHVDFNYHPIKPDWFRNINILLYLNQDWKESYGGDLKLRDGRVKNSEALHIQPLFNRAVIMFTRDYTLHGYEPIQFPEGSYRRSIAVYGYTKVDEAGAVRTTVWYPEDGGYVKRFLGKHMPKLVKIKTMILGSGTKNNR